MFIMVEGSSKRRGSRYESMLGPDLRSYVNDDGLYEFENDKDRQNFFFLDNVDVPFPKPPNNDNGNNGLLT